MRAISHSPGTGHKQLRRAKEKRAADHSKPGGRQACSCGPAPGSASRHAPPRCGRDDQTQLVASFDAAPDNITACNFGHCQPFLAGSRQIHVIRANASSDRHLQLGRLVHALASQICARAIKTIIICRSRENSSQNGRNGCEMTISARGRAVITQM